MNLKSWASPVGRLVLASACAAALCGAAIAADGSADAQAIEQFRADAKKSLDLMFEDGPKVLKVTPREITIARPKHVCGSGTHPNTATDVKRYLEALAAINAANAAGREIAIRVQSLDTLCRPRGHAPTPPASAASMPGAVSSAAAG